MTHSPDYKKYILLFLLLTFVLSLCHDSSTHLDLSPSSEKKLLGSPSRNSSTLLILPLQPRGLSSLPNESTFLSLLKITLQIPGIYKNGFHFDHPFLPHSRLHPEPFLLELPFLTPSNFNPELDFADNFAEPDSVSGDLSDLVGVTWGDLLSRASELALLGWSWCYTVIFVGVMVGRGIGDNHITLAGHQGGLLVGLRPPAYHEVLRTGDHGIETQARRPSRRRLLCRLPVLPADDV